jgi:hypothetical protein
MYTELTGNSTLPALEPNPSLHSKKLTSKNHCDNTGKMKTSKTFMTITANKEREQLGDRRKDGKSNCNSGDGTEQMVEPWMFMMMVLTFMMPSK